jgi:hypothetical protein
MKNASESWRNRRKKKKRNSTRQSGAMAMAMKKKPESNPDPVARREALASDVEKFLNSGKEIEQIPNGVSSYSPQGPVKSLNSQKTGPVQANASASSGADGKTEPSTAETVDTSPVADTPVKDEAATK